MSASKKVINAQDDLIKHLREQLGKVIAENSKLKTEVADLKDSLFYAWGKYSND